jgi:hypothetical protein
LQEKFRHKFKKRNPYIQTENRELMLKKGVMLLILVALSISFLAAEGPRGPLCNPFKPSVENHIWFWWPEGIAGFEFDDDGNLLYIVDGVPAQYGELVSSSVQKEFQKLPLSGEFVYWHPIKKGGLGGFWLKHFAVKEIEQPWGTVTPGVDFNYSLKDGKHIKEATRADFELFRDQPFESPLENYVWKIDDDDLYGIEFDRKGAPRYIVHGVPGEYSLNDVPSAEYAVWYPVSSKGDKGYWLKHTAIKHFRMLWGEVVPGVDRKFISRYTLKGLTTKDVTGYTDEPFANPLQNCIWKKTGETIRGYQFDDNSHLLYVIDGVPGMYSLDDVPYTGEYTAWYPVSPGSIQGYWLKCTAVRTIETEERTIPPGIDYVYTIDGGQHISNLGKSAQFTDEPVDELPDSGEYIWSLKKDELYGAYFKDGKLLYIIHGIPGAYSLNDVPLSGEYVVWFPAIKGDKGYWLKFVAVSEFEMESNTITYGIDLYYYQKEGHGISWLTRDHYYENWDLRKMLKYLWSIFNSD